MPTPQQQRAIDGYQLWFSRHPGVKNPTDLNCREKYEFAMELGWACFRQMQQQRKSNTEKAKFPYPWTKYEYWSNQYPIVGKPQQMEKDAHYNEGEAKQLYEEWFLKHPYLKNPTDVNHRDKFEFALKIGWDKYAMMQHARKNNVARTGYPCPWTQPDYWENLVK